MQYLYEGQQALGEIRNGQLSQRLLTGLSLDETIARIALNSSGQKDAANNRIFMTDALNSVIAQLSDDSATAGSIQNSYGYSPYGEAVTVGPDAAKNPVQYASRENDQTGLMFYRPRYYDPVMKRFISSDPIGLAGGMNMYSYVGGDLVRYFDPDGLRKSTGSPTLDRWLEPTTPPRNCITAECAAGIRPAPSENRNTSEVEYGQCKLVCQIVVSPPIAICNAVLGGGLLGTAAAAAGKAGFCSMVCK